MAKTIETIATINSSVRTLLAVVFLGAASAGGYYAYNTYHAQEIKAQQAETKLAEVQTEVANANKRIAAQMAELQEKDLVIQLKQQQRH